MSGEIIKVDFTGLRAMRRKLDEIIKQSPTKLEKAVRKEAEYVLTKAKRETVPVDLGPLRSSGHVSSVKWKGDTVEVKIAFGGPAAPYALAIHEHPSRYSPPSWRGKPIEGIRSVREREPWSLDGRGPKYLERPLRESLSGMARRITEELSL